MKLYRFGTPRPTVLFVLPATVPGGAEIRLLQMLPQFTRIRPVLLTQRSLPGVRELALECHYFEDMQCSNPYAYDLQNSLHYAQAIALKAHRLRPALTFGWMHHGTYFVTLAALTAGLRGLRFGCILGPPTAHFRFCGHPPSTYERVLFGLICRGMDALITPSFGVREDLIRHFHAPAARLHCIYNGVDLARIHSKARQTLVLPPKQRPWIVTASRLSAEKGLDVLLAAFARLRQHMDAQLILLGEGPDRARLEQLMASLGLQGQVWLPGHQDNPFPWIARADVFAMASRLEGFGNALVEAMALGIPVVSTACEWGPQEIIEAGKSGILVPVDDATALAEALQRVLQDRTLAAQLSTGARQRAGCFSFAQMLTRYEQQLLAALIEDKNTAS
ncbi:glycosyltransferase [Thiorhodospira sibirica]|uniref:glycosyltransferase n=1 Tax=Thiorhodospira sibirica TaxID=154347 RepID=UPI00022C1117|nr:glycosyltransferase [Thiorhodospira sibirica]